MAQIHSLKLTIQDVLTKDAAKIAAVMGKLYVDNGEKKFNEVTGEFEPEYETINFTTALFNHPEFQSSIKGMIVEALTLKDMKIAKESGTFSHYVEAVTGVNLKK